MRSKVTNLQLWQSSIHEAGHVVTAQRFSMGHYPRKAITAAVYPIGGGGCASISREGISDFHWAVVLASGDRAARMVSRYPTPRRITKPATFEQQISGERMQPALSRTICQKLGRGYDSLTNDSEQIADFCWRHSPSNPRDWVIRYKRIQALARYYCWLDRDKIHATAKKLFHDGAIFIPGDPLPTDPEPVSKHGSQIYNPFS